jgi:adenylyltransferase/sulfurtransferase
MDEQLRAENDFLKAKVAELEEKLAKATLLSPVESFVSSPFPDFPAQQESPLSKSDVERYGRQLIMKEIGATGQRKLIASSVLLVGAGGLASSAAMYLAGAGVGTIGLVDFDDIETSNLQRQIIHKQSGVGTSKAESAVRAIREYNPDVKTIAYKVQFSSSNALEIVKPYDLVLDCTDNVTSRYLINDACVLMKKPLVSGSALRMEGQVTVYHLNSDTPCYRCMFKEPPPKAAQGSCSNEGVLGVVPGIIGCLQALEAIKILAHTGTPLAARMIMFDAMSSTFRNFKLRPRDKNCAICGDNPSISQLVDYELFCGASANDKPTPLALIKPEQHISVQQYATEVQKTQNHILLDVRPSLQYDICALQNSINIPLSDLESRLSELQTLVKDRNQGDSTVPIFTICRRGNDSQRALLKLESLGFTNIKNVTGGVAAWAQNVDPEFPIY